MLTFVPAVPAEHPDSASCRQNRADRALDLMHEIELLGGRRVDYVVFVTFGVCTDVPVISYDRIRFTYAYPAEHRGLAVLVPCAEGCGAELPIEVDSPAQVALIHGSLWAHDCEAEVTAMTLTTPETDERTCRSCGESLVIGEGITLLNCPSCGTRAVGSSERSR